MFENLLPDAEPIRRRVAERVGAAGTDAYSLLTAIGRDCVGDCNSSPMQRKTILPNRTLSRSRTPTLRSC